MENNNRRRERKEEEEKGMPLGDDCSQAFKHTCLIFNTEKQRELDRYLQA